MVASTEVLKDSCPRVRSRYVKGEFKVSIDGLRHLNDLISHWISTREPRSRFSVPEITRSNQSKVRSKPHFCRLMFLSHFKCFIPQCKHHSSRLGLSFAIMFIFQVKKAKESQRVCRGGIGEGRLKRWSIGWFALHARHVNYVPCRYQRLADQVTSGSIIPVSTCLGDRECDCQMMRC